jgi:hypothetical protein
MKIKSLALAALLAAPAAEAARAPSLAAQGVECHANADPGENGETHWCLFDPRHHGRHDFGSRNGRAGYVVSMLGPDCELIEILDDAEQPGADAGKPPLRRVSVACTDE